MDFSEQKNLSSLLYSDVDANVELGLELLKNNETYSPIFTKELVLITQLHQAKNLSKEAEELLLKYTTKKELETIKSNFSLFQNNLYYGKEYALKAVPQHEAVREIYMPFIEQNANYAQRYYAVGQTLARIEEFKEIAEVYLKICIKANPSHKDCLYTLAYLIAEDKNRFEEAVVLYSKVLEHNPNLCGAWNNLAILYEQNGFYLKAYEHYSKAVQYDTYGGTSYKKNLASICVHFLPEKKYQQEAKSLLEDVLRIAPNDSSTWVTYGNYLWLCEQDYEATEKAYKKGLKFNPTSCDLLGNLGELYVDIFQNYKKGLYYYRKALKTSCSAYQLCNIFTFCIVHQNNFKKAKKLFEELINKEPAILSKKPVYLTPKQYKAFQQAYELSLKKNP